MQGCFSECGFCTAKSDARYRCRQMNSKLYEMAQEKGTSEAETQMRQFV